MSGFLEAPPVCHLSNQIYEDLRKIYDLKAFALVLPYSEMMWAKFYAF